MLRAALALLIALGGAADDAARIAAAPTLTDEEPAILSVSDDVFGCQTPSRACSAAGEKKRLAESGGRAKRDGNVLREQGNGYSSEGHDRTAHAEKLLASWAARTLSLEQLRECTLYTSAEPCAMCSGAIYWAGIGRVVYGLGMTRLHELMGRGNGGSAKLAIPCRGVLAGGRPLVEVVGPVFQNEAQESHRGYWQPE